VTERRIAARDQPTQADLIEQVLTAGDLSRLGPEQRASYYAKVCESLGLNPYTRPFEYLSIQGKLTLYARKDATDQLRRIHRISTEIVSREPHEDLFVVTARATTPDGRSDEAVGAVPIAGLRGEALAAAIMKAETKAKRRVTLSIVGLGWTDESELDGVPRARVVASPPEPPPAAPADPPARLPPVAEVAAPVAEVAPPPSDAAAPPTDVAPPAAQVAAPATIRDARAAAEAVQIATARRDPIWRCQVALADACRRVGVATAPLDAHASRADVQAWIDRHRAALRDRAA
jgi:hypothetical protein